MNEHSIHEIYKKQFKLQHEVYDQIFKLNIGVIVLLLLILLVLICK